MWTTNEVAIATVAYNKSRFSFYMALHGVDIPPYHHDHPLIYNIKRSTVNVYKIDRGRSVRSAASVFKFSL